MDETFDVGPGITFNAKLFKLSILEDGSVRVTFDMPHTQLQTAWKLAPLKGQTMQVRTLTAQMIAESYK